MRAHALADNIPHHDLRVTKGHSLFIDGLLIPVEYLVNHRTILWDDRAQEVTVYHVELDTHDVLLSNGLPAESYRDDGNRWLFQNANSGWGQPPKPPYAPVVTGGPIVDAAWRRYLDRAGPRPGLPLTDDPDLHFVVDGVRVNASHRKNQTYVFSFEGLPDEVRISSFASVPQEVGIARDSRCLGVAIRRIIVRQGTRFCATHAGDPLLTEGFHDFESSGDFRWTDGYARLPASLFAGLNGAFEVVVHLGCTTLYIDTGAAFRAA